MQRLLQGLYSPFIRRISLTRRWSKLCSHATSSCHALPLAKKSVSLSPLFWRGSVPQDSDCPNVPQVSARENPPACRGHSPLINALPTPSRSFLFFERKSCGNSKAPALACVCPFKKVLVTLKAAPWCVLARTCVQFPCWRQQAGLGSCPEGASERGRKRPGEKVRVFVGLKRGSAKEGLELRLGASGVRPASPVN